jgi:hypothetical protein
MVKLKHEIMVTPAFDKRSDDPKKDYGIGACRICFAVVGKKGAVTVDFFTNWFLESTVKEYRKEGIFKNNLGGEKDKIKTKIDLEKTSRPIHAGYFTIHSKKKVEYSQKTKKCCFINGETCYSYGSCMHAEMYLPILLSKGSDGIFKELEKEYKRELEAKK